MNKTALITGASGGIGRELAKIHAANGDNLVLIARTGSKLEELKNELENKFNIKVYNIEKDLSVRDAGKEVYEEVKSKGITVSYLINNAGFGDFGLFADCNWDKQEKMVNLNIITLIQMIRLFLPDMIEKREGKILNVSSIAAFQPGPTMSVYFASKAFVQNFSEALNNEVKDKGITVTALCPGSTDTDFHAVTLGDPNPVNERKMSSSGEVAEYGYRAMMKGKPVAIHGLKNAFMVYAARFFPRSFIVRMVRRIQEKKHNKEG